MASVVADSTSSLGALRNAHNELLESLPDDETALPDDVRRVNYAKISEFMRQVVESGAQLDSPADRRIAQGLIDYWVASAYASSREQYFPRSLPPRSELVLKPFDEAKVTEAARRSDEFIDALDTKDQELARKIVMHLVRLNSAGEPCRVAPEENSKLLSLGDVQPAEHVVGELIKAGALKVKECDDGERVELGYEALIRHWPRLRGWIDERSRFRKLAQVWDESGRDSGALISDRPLLKQTDAFDDLSKLELEYKQESKKLLDTSRRARIVVAVAALIFVIGLIPAYRVLQSFVERRDTKTAEADFRENIWIVKSGDAAPDRKAKAFKWLVENQPRLRPELRLFDFSNAHLANLDLNDVSMRDTNFANATLKGVAFDRSNLPAARFINSKMEGAKGPNGEARNARFVSTVMTSARFDGSTLSSVKFNGARLNFSSFDRVLFCEGIDFSGADIRMVSFQNVKFDGTSVPIFRNTVWWLAAGWSLEQVRLLSTRYADIRVTETKGFEDEMLEHNVNIGHSARGTIDRANALNGKAWTLATYGVSANKYEEAEKIALEAIEIAKNIAVPKTTLANFQDTLAYVRLQQGKTAEAIQLLAEAVANDTDPGLRFRYAVALNATDNTKDAAENLKLSVSTTAGNYTPSHELFLLRNYIGGEFKGLLNHLLNERPVPDISRPEPCPRKSP